MLPKETSIVSLLFAAVIAVIAGNSAMRTSEVMSQKADAQQQAVEDFQRWKASYLELTPLNEKWDKAFPALAEAKDLYSLYNMIGGSPKTNPDLVIVDRVQKLTFGGQELSGLQVCLTTAGQGGLVFEDKSFTRLITGLKALAGRDSIQLGSVLFRQESGKAQAIVKDFCLILNEKSKGVEDGQS